MEFKKLDADIGGWEGNRDQDCEEEITYRRSKKTEVPKEAITFDDFKSRSNKRKRGECETCWLCQTSSSAKDGSSTGLGRFFKLFTDNYKQCEEQELYTQLRELYMHDIYEPMLKQGHDVPLLSVEDIREHFLEHAFDPSVYVSEEIKFLKTVASTMKNHIFCEDGKQRIDVNDKRVWNYLKVQKQIVELYNTRISNMNFYDVNTAVCKN
tara:strand:- start:598 stop:1227 length:630 start_codon:yes stop_codon:yes gene_type:complete